MNYINYLLILNRSHGQTVHRVVNLYLSEPLVILSKIYSIFLFIFEGSKNCVFNVCCWFVSTNQKQEWPVVAMFINGSELNEQSL
jgi:hypothetical protein